MNIENIKTFIAVYRSGSFAGVANDRNIAPSSVSRAIAQLEDELQTRLFQRTTRSLTPTHEGEEYFQRILPLIEEMEQAHQLLIDKTAAPSGLLRVTASVSYGQIVLAPRLKAFRRRYPDIELELILSDGHVDLISDQVDVAIRHGALEDSSLIARKLANVTYHLVASENYIERNCAPQNPEDLADHDLVTFAYENFRHAWEFDVDGIAQKIAIKPVIACTNAAIIRQAVLNDVGIALLADWTIKSDLASGALIELLPEWQLRGLSRDTAIWLVYPSRRFISGKTKAFIDFMIDAQ